MPTIYDHNICVLGEGLFWNPYHRAPFWFDIKEKFYLEGFEGSVASGNSI